MSVLLSLFEKETVLERDMWITWQIKKRLGV